MGILKQYLEAYNDDLVLRVDEFISSTEQSKINSYFDSTFGISGDDAMSAGEYNSTHDLPIDVQRQVVEDAKDGVDGAVFYCYYRMFPKMRAGWKIYLGQDANHYVGKDKAEFYSLAYLALAGDFSKFNQGARATKELVSDVDYIGLRKNALEYVDLNKIGSMNPFQSLAQVFTNCLRETIKQVMIFNNSNGATEMDNKSDVMKGSTASKFVSIDKEIENDKSGAATIGEKIADEKAETADDIDSRLESEGMLDEFVNLLMGRQSYELYGDSKKRLPDDPKFTGISPLNVFKVIVELSAKGENSNSAISKELAKRVGKSGVIQPATWAIEDPATNNPGALGVLKMACENNDMKLEPIMQAAIMDPDAYFEAIDDCADPSWLEHPWGQRNA